MSRYRKILYPFVFNAMIVSFLVISLLFACEQFEPERIVKVKTGSVAMVDYTSCRAEGILIDKGENGIAQHGFCWSLIQNPTTGDNKKELGPKSSTGGFIGNLTGLSSNTTYYVRAYATNSVGTAYGNEVSFTTLIYISRGTVTDYDGNTYNTVQIGNQVWMAENLKVTHYSAGTAIQLVENNSAWDALDYTDKAYCYYNNNSSIGDTSGALYNWAAAMNGASSSDANPSGVQGVCPDGWHVPSDAEWKELEVYLGMSQAEADGEGWRGTNEGGMLKEIGTSHWNNPNTSATNESGFTALPRGGRGHDGTFGGLGYSATFWSATELGSSNAWYRHLYYNYSEVYRPMPFSYKTNGFSVRCVKDN